MHINYKKDTSRTNNTKPTLNQKRLFAKIKKQVESGQKINIEKIRPWHMEGVINFSDAQREAMAAYYRVFKEKWIENMLEREIQNIKEDTLALLMAMKEFLI